MKVQTLKKWPVGQAVKTSPFHGGNTSSILVRVIFLDSSMVEHSAVNRVVAGSSPARGVRDFSLCADVAQLAEQLICNQQVIGSSPIIGFAKANSRIRYFLISDL